MVHISLPHRISGHKTKGKDKTQNGTGTPETDRRPSPNRGPSTYSTPGGEKPLILKVYVIRGRNLAAKDKSGTSDPVWAQLHAY